VKTRFKVKERTKVIMIVDALSWYNESPSLAFPFAASVVPALAAESASGEAPSDSEVSDSGTCCVTASPLPGSDVGSGDNVRDPVIVVPVMGIGSVIRGGEPSPG